MAVSIQDWGALGEIIGAIAVVASLVYLGVQIRLNTRQLAHSVEATRIASLERNIESANRMRELLIRDRDLAELFLTGLRDCDALQGPDKLRFELLLRNFFSGFQGAYIRHLSLDDDPDGFRGVERMIETILANDGVRRFLEQADTDWRPEFRAFIDARIAAVDGRARS